MADKAPVKRSEPERVDNQLAYLNERFGHLAKTAKYSGTKKEYVFGEVDAQVELFKKQFLAEAKTKKSGKSKGRMVYKCLTKTKTKKKVEAVA
jgi:hypothetical protein